MISKTNFAKFIIYLALISILTSCIPNGNMSYGRNQGLTDTAQETCIEPLFKNGIPIGEDGFYYYPEFNKKEELAPSKPWRKASILPFSVDKSIDFLFSREVYDIEELWFEAVEEKIVRYWTFYPETGIWQNRINLTSVKSVFMDSNSKIWFLVIEDKEIKLFVYNEDTYQTEYKMNLDLSLTEYVLSDVRYSNKHSLWLLGVNKNTSKDVVFNLNLETGMIDKRFEASHQLFRLAVDREGRIFTFDAFEGRIERFNPGDDTVSHLIIPENYISLYAGYPKFFFSEDNWVYLNDRAFFYNDEGLSQLHIPVRSPIFISTEYDYAFPFAWESPEPQAETEDGRIWYKSKRGLAWHQPETGEWCMFTSAQSNIVKDSQENLWIVYDNALYMLPASETSKKE
jgi:hypothetical protein